MCECEVADESEQYARLSRYVATVCAMYTGAKIDRETYRTILCVQSMGEWWWWWTGRDIDLGG